MKRVAKTKDEKKEIKKYKATEKQHVLKKERKTVRKEHFYLLGAVIILILLLSILIYILFFGKSKEAIVPELPTYENVDVGVVDFEDKDASANDLNSKKNSNISVSYDVVSDYYKEGILLSNTQVEYLNSEFIVTSGPQSEKSFVSSISKDGKLKWLTKLDDKEFGKFHIYKTTYINNHYYVAGITEKDNKESLTIVKLTTNGKKVTTRIIKENVSSKVKDIVFVKEKIAIILSDSKDITINFTDEDLKENKNEIVLSKSIDNSSYLNYQSSSAVDDVLNIVVNNSDKFYIATINVDNYTVVSSEMSEVNNLKTDETVHVSSYLKGFTAYTQTSLYKFDQSNKLINKFDYSGVKLENDEEFKEKYKDDEFISGEDLINSIEIETVKSDENKIVVNTKTLYSSIYDIYDLNLKINKRIILDSFKYSYPDGVILNSFYIDGTIYEVYSYGTETPSIMISKIG